MKNSFENRSESLFARFVPAHAGHGERMLKAGRAMLRNGNMA